MEESPLPAVVINTNGYHDKPSPEPQIHEIEAEVIKVQNGEVAMHGKGIENMEESAVL